MSRQGYDLSKEQLKSYGFRECAYDYDTDTWTIKRYWHKGTNKKYELYDIHVHMTNDEHKYGKTRSYPNISFSAKPYGCFSISFPRFIWAWCYGFISANDKIRKKKDAKKKLSLDSFELVDWKDHSYYEKGNSYTAIRNKAREFVKQEWERIKADYEAGRPIKFKF